MMKSALSPHLPLQAVPGVLLAVVYGEWASTVSPRVLGYGDSAGESGKESTVWPGERNSEDVRVLLWLRYNKNHLFLSQ